MQGQNLVHLGTLARAHGLKGEISVLWHSESIKLLKGTIYLQDGEKPPYQAKVSAVRLHKGYPLVCFEHILDRNQAEAMRGQKIFVPRSALPKLGTTEYYIYDIIDCSIYLAPSSTETKQYLGLLEKVDLSFGQEIWSIRTEDQKEILFPAVPNFVIEVDIEKKSIIIAPPPGLLDLYLTE